MAAESSTSHRRRRSLITAPSPHREPTASKRPFKRVREATPICDDSASADLAETAAAHATTTATGGDETSGQYLVDDERRDQVIADTSEREDPSVLFSEQGGAQTEPTEALDERHLVDEEDPDETTLVQVPDVVPSKRRLSRGEATAELITKAGFEAVVGDFEVEEDYGDLPWMRDREVMEGDDTASQSKVKQEEWDEYLNGFSDEDERERAIQEGYFPESSIASPSLIRTTRELYLQAQETGEDIEYHSGDSDAFEMEHRPVLERAGVKRDIRVFAESMDLLAEPDEVKRDYQIIDRLGEGESH